jgi:Ca2+-binding EF-hand superfamily protein
VSRDIDFNEFCQILMPVFTGEFEDDELYYAFKKFDLDNSGTVTVEELKLILSKIGQFYTDEQISAMISSVDVNNDGKLNFQG